MQPGEKPQLPAPSNVESAEKRQPSCEHTPTEKRRPSKSLNPSERRPSKSPNPSGRRPSRRESKALVLSAAGVVASRNKRYSTLFEHLDTSGDFQVDKKEFMNVIPSWTACCPRIHDADLDDFAVWDSDGSGFLCEGEFFCFCDALWQILGERDFITLEAKAFELAKSKSLSKPAASKGGEVTMTFGATLTTTEAEEPEEKLRSAMRDVRRKDGTAVRDVGRKVLRKAINEARADGVDRQLVEDAVHLVRKVEVEEVLQRAMDSNNPKLLKVAILNSTAVELDATMVKQAEALLAVLEARESIKQSILTRDPEIVQAAIAKARRASLDPSEIEEAQHAANRLEFNKVIATKDELQLMKFIASLQNKDCKDPILEKEASQAMLEVKKVTEARKSLANCMVKGGAQEMKRAIDAAQFVHMPEEELQRARQVWRKEEAREALVAAIVSEKRIHLVQALEVMTEFDTDTNTPEIDTAQHLLKKLDVSRDISLALHQRESNPGAVVDVKKLREMVAEAQLRGVEEAKVAKVEEIITLIETQGSLWSVAE